MFGQIIRHDWRNLRAEDHTIWAIAGILFIAVDYGVYNGAAWVRFQTRF